MPSRKVIRCYADYPFKQYPNAKVPWDDIYLTWKGKPGRKTYHASPCVLCEAEVRMDLKIHEEIRQKDAPAHDDWYREDDARYFQVLEDLKTQEFACNGEGAGLNIYTKSQGINKHEAERMIAWWLAKTHGIQNPKFEWNKPKIIVTPMGFGMYQE